VPSLVVGCFEFYGISELMLFEDSRTPSRKSLRITATWLRSTMLFYNFCRVHQTLRVTSAMEAGLTQPVWSLEELVGLLETKRYGGAAA